MMRIEQTLRETARQYGRKAAVIVGESRLSYADLDIMSDGLAAGLRRRHVLAGDRVLILLDNDVEAVVSLFGVWKAGAVACPLYAGMRAEKLALLVGSTQPAAIVTHSRLRHTVEDALRLSGLAPLLIVCRSDGHNDAGDAVAFETMTALPEEEAPPAMAGAKDLALLIHTSGSTGRPKGVMLSHSNIHFACRTIVSYLENTADDIVLSVLPLSFGYGITQVITMVMTGGTLVLEKSFAFPRKILDRLAEVKATGFPMVPAMAALIGAMTDIEPGALPHLRYMTSAAAALPPVTSERIRRHFPSTRLFIMYGQTECLRTTYLPPEEVDRRPLSVGRPLPETRAFVVDDNGDPAPAGMIGELVVEGPHIMSGYWRDEESTAKALSTRHGSRRLHTGDLFRADEVGFLYFVSRRDDIIKTRGEKVSPQEVERALYALPGIREAAVRGVYDPVFGEVVQAYVALEPQASLTERQIMRHCANLLEDYMVPKSIRFVDALPRTPSGKIRLGAAGIADEAEGNAA